MGRHELNCFADNSFVNQNVNNFSVFFVNQMVYYIFAEQKTILRGNFSHVVRPPPHPPSMGTPMSKIPFFFLKKFFFRKIKHVLAPQDDFGMQKKLGKQTKKVGLGQTPPPSMGKIPT